MSTGKKKFGAFGGVFTPSILTILGVIMYLRLGWVVGHAGLLGTIMIIVIAHVISITTGLSISSIATDKKVGAGGVYYVLSRSLGLPIGGAIGLTLFVGTALSIALYIVGFSESFNAILGLENTIDNIRLTGSIALLSLTIIAFISTSLAIKTQYFILGAIFISLGAIIFGSPAELNAANPEDILPSDLPLEAVFAIFFPAVTGFTAGIAMSGDLKDPKKAIPIGTISAIAVGFVVYICLALFLYYRVDADILRKDYNILEKIAVFAPLVIAGIWGATLSSALGGILGGPRILQAMSLDKITPTIFGKEQGKTKEPRLALIIAILLAEGGILIGDLDIVARVVSMFYLAAYGFINISFFLESWASVDFRPSFKVNKWFGFLGFVATFGVMFQLDMIAMFLALIIIGGIYLWLTRKEIALGTGDIWRSVWSTSVKEGLKRLEAKEDHKRNWKPNILLFSGNSEARPHLIEFSQALAGRAGLVTNFDLIENKGMDILFTKHKQSVKDELLQKYGIFGRQIEVQNVYKGIETIAATFGFSGIDPNTVLMGWARNTKDPIWFAQMTQKLIDLDYNVLYMDYDEERGFGKREQIDLWWRGISNNAELMLQLAKFISYNADWRKSRIRILLVNDFNVDRRIIENRISHLLDDFRLRAEIKVIENHLERKPFYDILKTHSLKSDLVLIGIPYIVEGSESRFVQNTNDLTDIIGTTLLVKASTTFDVTQLGLKEMKDLSEDQSTDDLVIDELKSAGIEILDQEINKLGKKFDKINAQLSDKCLKVVAQHYHDFAEELKEVQEETSATHFSLPIKLTEANLTQPFIDKSNNFSKETLPLLGEILIQEINTYLANRRKILEDLETRLELPRANDAAKDLKNKINWKRAVAYSDNNHFTPGFVHAIKEYGVVSSGIVIRSKQLIKNYIGDLYIEKSKKSVEKNFLKNLEELHRFIRKLVENTLQDIRNTDRKILNELCKRGEKNELNRLYGKTLFSSSDNRKRERMDFLENYGHFWLRNQQLFHYRFETGIELKRTNLILDAANSNLLERIMKDPVRKYYETLHSIKSQFSTAKNAEQVSVLLDLANNTLNMWDYLPPFRKFIKEIGKASEFLPAEVEMMDTESQMNIQDNQGKQISTVSFSVDKIADYLIETRFISAVQENLEHLNGDFNTMVGKYINLGSSLNFQLKNSKEAVDFKTIIEQTIQNLEEIEYSINQSYDGFKAEMKERLNGINSLLEVQHIIDQADVLKQYIRRKELQKGLKGSMFRMRAMGNRRLNQLTELAARHKQNPSIKEYLELNHRIKHAPDLIREFIQEIKLDEEALKILPYYYKQLFTSKHLHSTKSFSYREEEIDQLKTSLHNIDQGNSGAIMLTGPSRSGKSFLTEKLVNQYIPGNTFYISAPQGGSIRPRDLHYAFKMATGISGEIENVLQESPPKSIFVFNDLEKWWLNHKDGAIVINKLCKLIHEFGSQHYFIFNSNVHALEMIRRTSRLNEILSAVVLLKPLKKDELRKEILKRHRIGGLSIYFKGQEIQSERMDRQMDKLFNRIYKFSNGNIGSALMIWLSNIKTDSNGRFNLDLPDDKSFPDLTDSEWNNVLGQLLIHKTLSEERFEKLYDSMDAQWVEKMKHELQKSSILKAPGNLEYKLQNKGRTYLENYLTSKGVL